MTGRNIRVSTSGKRHPETATESKSPVGQGEFWFTSPVGPGEFPSTSPVQWVRVSFDSHRQWVRVIFG